MIRSWGSRMEREVPLYFPHCAVPASSVQRTVPARVPAHANLSCASFLLSRPAQPLHFFILTDFRLGLSRSTPSLQPSPPAALRSSTNIIFFWTSIDCRGTEK